MGDRKQQRQLLGYVLGALDDRRQRRIDEQLARDPDLQAELAQVEETVRPLRTLTRVYQPRPGLAARACSMIFAYSDALTGRKGEPRAVRRPARERARTMSPAAVPPTSTASWGWSDLLVAAGVFLAIAGLVFPAIQTSRMNLRLNACQNNLRQIGAGLAQFQQAHPAAFGDAMAVAPGTAAPVSYSSLLRDREPADLAPPWLERPAPRLPPVALVSLNRAPVSPHQGFSQRVHGQNLLFFDGHANFFAMAPITVDLSNDAPAPDKPTVAPWPTRGAGASPLAPFVLVSRPGR